MNNKESEGLLHNDKLQLCNQVLMYEHVNMLYCRKFTLHCRSFRKSYFDVNKSCGLKEPMKSVVVRKQADPTQ